MVVGCGAVGSFAIEALARAGIGNLVVIDNDKIEETNINRQLFALDSTIGLAKVDVASARIHDINPETNVRALNMFWDINSDIKDRPDFVIDAIDSVESKLALYSWCVAHNIPFISSMGAARKTDISQIKIARLSGTHTCPLAAKIRKLVRDTNLPDFDVVFSTECAAPYVRAREFGSLVTVTGTFGLMMAEHVIKKILAK